MYEKNELLKSGLESLNFLEKIIRHENTKISKINNKNYNYITVLLFATLTSLTMNEKELKNNNKYNLSKGMIKYLEKGKIPILENNKYLVVKLDNENLDNIPGQTINDKFKFIRNNIAHGDFKIEDKYVVMGKENIKIHQGLLSSLLLSFFVKSKKMYNNIPYTTRFMCLKNPYIGLTNNLDEILKQYVFVEGNIEKIDKNKDANEDVFNAVKNILIDTENNESKTSVNNVYTDEYKKELNDFLKNYNLKFDYKISQTKKTKFLEDEFKKINPTFDNIQAFLSKYILEDYMLNDTEYVDNGLLALGNLGSIVDNNLDISFNQLNNLNKNQILLAIELIKFNMIFSYNNDYILNESFDYNILKTNNFKINKIDNLQEKTKNYVKELEKTIKSYEKISIPKCPPLEKIPESKRIKVKENYENILMNYNNKKIELIKIKDKLKNSTMYIKNKCIITHLRNSITHGYFEIKNRDYDPVFILRDFNKNNELTFEAIVSFKNLKRLYKDEEINNNIKNNELLKDTKKTH